MRILFFAGARIDMANDGRHDPQSGLPLRVLGFLKSPDAIIEAIIKDMRETVCLNSNFASGLQGLQAWGAKP